MSYSHKAVVKMLDICERNPDHPLWLKYMLVATRWLKAHSPKKYRQMEAEFAMKIGGSSVVHKGMEEAQADD